jgi:hypothetical protein
MLTKFVILTIIKHRFFVNFTLDKEKSKHASLAQQNDFGPQFLHSLLRLVKGTAKPNTCQRRV